jgi:uncharacterized protein YbjT (DUF2867 family)
MGAERSALILGATGLVGGLLLDRLLADPGWTRVEVIGRRPTGRTHPKLTELAGELDRLDAHAASFGADAVFCCLGTTLRRAGSREAFRRVDLDAVAAAARLAARSGAKRFVLVSAAGASRRSRFFYSRVKAEAEAAVGESGVPGVVILRPSLILGPRAERRPAEAIAQRAARVLAPLMQGPLRRLRGVPAEAVARTMVRLAAAAGPGVRVVENEEILGPGSAAADA